MASKNRPSYDILTPISISTISEETSMSILIPQQDNKYTVYKKFRVSSDIMTARPELI